MYQNAEEPEEEPQETEEEFQFILRLPEHLAEKINQSYQRKCSEGEDEILSSSNGNLEGQNTPENQEVEYWIEYDGKDYDSDMKDRKYIFYYGEEQYDALLMDLPTITESYKTLDDKTLYKSNNICQVLVVAPTPRILDPESNTYVQVEKPERLFCFDGLTPASKNVHNRFHEPARKAIFGQGGEYPSYKTAKETEKLLTSWLEDKSRTVVREDYVNKTDRSNWMKTCESFELVDENNNPLDGELLDDEIIQMVCKRIWEGGKKEREAQEAAELEQKRRIEEEARRAAEAKANPPAPAEPANLPANDTRKVEVNHDDDNLQLENDALGNIGLFGNDANGDDMLDDDILFDDDELKGMLNDDNLDFGNDAMDGAMQAVDSEEDEDSEDLDEADFMS